MRTVCSFIAAAGVNLINRSVLQMIIGGNFNKKSKLLLTKIGQIAEEDTRKKISVKQVNSEINLDRTEIRNFLEYLEGLGYIEIVTIGGPYLYGHIKITERGIEKYLEIK